MSPTSASASTELESLELKISRFLRVGVIISGALLFVGWMALIQFRENPFREAQAYQPERVVERLSFLLAHPGENFGLLTCYLGLAVLISLPVLRVAMTAALFFRQRDRLLGWIAVTVLAVLLFSFALGIEI